jgi:CRP/FNR family cyclic AMP-dependent transcriptional regulator
MSALIRKAGPDDTAAWIDLVTETLGEEYSARQVFDPEWVRENLSERSGHETWVAESDGRLVTAITILSFPPTTATKPDMSGGLRTHSFTKNPVCNLGRNLCRPEAFADGSAEALLQRISEFAAEREQMAVARVLASDNGQQVAFEKTGFACVGFQPDKHFHCHREEVLFYVKPSRSLIDRRVTLSESIPQIAELAAAALGNLHVSAKTDVRDGGQGYPLQTDIEFLRVDGARYEEELEKIRNQNPPREVSGGFNTGHGYMRVDQPMPSDAFLVEREGTIVGGLHFIFDELDRCVRVLNAFCVDGLSMGAMLHHLVKLSHDQLNAFYVEADILITAGKLLISAEQLGFVPAAYLPGFHQHAEGVVDIVKLVKFNQNFTIEEVELTAQARALAEVAGNCLESQSSGVAIVNLLRDLAIFKGLGDGELHKLGRLFTQKLFKPCEAIFDRNDSGDEAYVIMRGKVDIFLDGKSQPIASFSQGQVFGELSFLDGTPRGAKAIAAQPSILLIIRRSQFFELTQREPHLGLAVMKNIALELGSRLRQMNAASESSR